MSRYEPSGPSSSIGVTGPGLPRGRSLGEAGLAVAGALNGKPCVGIPLIPTLCSGLPLMTRRAASVAWATMSR